MALNALPFSFLFLLFLTQRRLPKVGLYSIIIFCSLTQRLLLRRRRISGDPTGLPSVIAHLFVAHAEIVCCFHFDEMLHKRQVAVTSPPPSPWSDSIIVPAGSLMSLLRSTLARCIEVSAAINSSTACSRGSQTVACGPTVVCGVHSDVQWPVCGFVVEDGRRCVYCIKYLY